MRNRMALTLLALLSFASTAHSQDRELAFPSNDEILLVVTQADRATAQYKLTIDAEATFMGAGQGARDAVARDRDVVDGIEFAVKVLKTNPQGFNSPAGFQRLLALDDASRNGLLCSTQALAIASLKAVAGDANGADSMTHIAQSCEDAATLLYTVSESVSALYARYLSAEQGLTKKAVDTATRCTEILKRNAPK